jgi:hypothetical protein
MLSAAIQEMSIPSFSHDTHYMFPLRVGLPAGYVLGMYLFSFLRTHTEAYIHGHLARHTFPAQTPWFLDKVVAAKDRFWSQLSSGFGFFVYCTNSPIQIITETPRIGSSDESESRQPHPGLVETIFESENARPDLEATSSLEAVLTDGQPDQLPNGTVHNTTTEAPNGPVILEPRWMLTPQFCIATSSTLALILFSPVETYLFRHLAYTYAFGRGIRIPGLLPPTFLPWQGQGNFRSWGSKVGLSLLVGLVIKAF